MSTCHSSWQTQNKIDRAVVRNSKKLDQVLELLQNQAQPQPTESEEYTDITEVLTSLLQIHEAQMHCIDLQLGDAKRRAGFMKAIQDGGDYESSGYSDIVKADRKYNTLNKICNHLRSIIDLTSKEDF